MAILKNDVKDKYTQIPNDLITDSNLSMGAKVLYCYISSKPTGWQIWNSEIQKTLNIHRKETIAKYWKELIENNWVSRESNKSENGKFTGGYTYVIKNGSTDFSDSEKNGSTENTEVVKNSTYNNTDINSNTNINSNKEEYKPLPKKDKFINKDNEILISTYTNQCMNHIPVSRFTIKNAKFINKAYEFLQEIDYDFDYFTEVCKKANELNDICGNKIDIFSVMNNHIGIMNGKYQDNKKSISDKLDEILKEGEN